MNRNITLITFILSLLSVMSFFSCNKEEDLGSKKSSFILPENFPPVSFPEGNEFTEARFELGKKLFFDPILSLDSSISCATCHKPQLAFSDNVNFSPGIEGRPGVRNAPTLTNVAYHPYFLKEGGVPTLEMQVLVPIQEENEFAHNIVDISVDLNDIPSYVEMSQAAYGRNPDPFVITRAISTFERALLSGGSKYDIWKNGNEAALNKEELLGKDLFFSKRLNCSECHNGLDFTNYEFKNNGLDIDYKDEGKMRLTRDTADLAMFKTPTLRNIELTAPYMHDGRFNSLEEVIEHYNSGGKNHRNKSDLIKPLGLSNQEKAVLIAFLKSLTDSDFTNDERWNP